MTEAELQELVKRVKSGTATSEEKLQFLREIETLTEEVKLALADNV